MVALVITPSNSILYVGNSNFVTSATQWMTNGAGGSTNDNEPFGSGLTIGGDPALGAIANSFGGYMSSVAMFSNSLSLQQIESLWVAGESNGAVQAPYIVQQPASTNVVLVAPGGIGSISANGFAALPAIGYWQVNNGSTWVQVSSADVSAPSIMTTVGGASGTLEVGVLQFTNFQAGDAGSYELVISNAGGWATSSVVVINPYSVTPGSYASLADSAGYSAVALWPLNEIVDPSTGISGSPAVAFDVIGGFNGTYGTNADNGIGNAAYGFAPVVGPGSQGLAGLPTAGALGVTNNPTYSNSYVNVAVSPTFPSTATNVTIAGWFYPRQTAAQTYEAGLFMTPNGGPGVAGIQYVGNGVNLGYHWDNNAAST
jgi:hypothetical protein